LEVHIDDIVITGYNKKSIKDMKAYLQ